MQESRAEHEAEWQEKYAQWNTLVDGRPLHELVQLWREKDEEASKIIANFSNTDPENYRKMRAVERLIGEGPYFPGNRKDFGKLPSGLACAMCPAFSRISSMENDELTVRCEWFYGIEEVKMELDSSKEGGAVQVAGNCKAEFGISLW